MDCQRHRGAALDKSTYIYTEIRLFVRGIVLILLLDSRQVVDIGERIMMREEWCRRQVCGGATN